MGMYTDPKRLRATDPGETNPEKNPLWAFQQTFNHRHRLGGRARRCYRQGKVGDVVIKKKLVEVLDALIEPIRTRRKQFEQRPDDVMDALRTGTERANAVAEETLARGEKGDEAGLFFAGVVDPLSSDRIISV